MSISWKRYTTFVRGVQNHYTDDDSLNEYFYRGKEDNNKLVLDLLWVAPKGNVHTLRLQGSWRRYLAKIRLGALESKTLR